MTKPIRALAATAIGWAGLISGVAAAEPLPSESLFLRSNHAQLGLAASVQPADRPRSVATVRPNEEFVLFNNDPDQGFLHNGYFYHPSGGFRFSVPEGAVVINEPHAVTVRHSEGIATFSVGAYNGDLRDYVSRVYQTTYRRTPDRNTVRLVSDQGVTIMAYYSPDRTTMIVGYPLREGYATHFILRSRQTLEGRLYGMIRSFGLIMPSFARHLRCAAMLRMVPPQTRCQR